MDLAALQAALDQARSTGDLTDLHAALRVEGWRPPKVVTVTQAEILERVEVDPVTGCWNWKLKLYDGYGRIKGIPAHRASWEAFIGPIPEGLHLDHLCRNRRCVRPDPAHLEPVEPLENDRRARMYVQQYPGEQVHNQAKRWCTHGHEYTPENTGTDKLGKRFCLACRRDHLHAWRQRLRETQPARGRWHVDAESWLEARDRLVPSLEGPTLSSVQVSALWGITHQAFSRWRARNPDLLRPVTGGGSSHVALRWCEAEVVAIMKFRTLP